MFYLNAEFKIKNPRKKILYVSYGGGHINMIIPLYRKIELENKYDQVIFALTTSHTKLINEKIPFISYKDFISDNPKALAYGKELSTMQANSSAMNPEETIAYLGFNFLDLVEKHGEEKAFDLYKKEGRFCFYPTTIMKQFISHINPDIVVSTNSPRSERAALVTAKQLNIPSLCLVDLFDRKDMPPIADFDLGTKACVINQFAKDMLIEMGRPKNDIIITGNSAFDKIYDPVYSAKAKSYRDKHSLHNQSVVLWARSAIAEDVPLSEACELNLLKFAQNNLNYTVIIRPHPNDAEQTLPITSSNIILSEKTDDIYTLVHAADIIYTLYSSVGLEAALINKKILQQTNTRVFSGFNLVELGYAAGISELSTLPEVLAEITSKKTSNYTFTDRQNLSATDNICAVISELI